MSQSSQAEPSVSEQGESLRYPWFAAIGIGLLVGLYGVYRILADGLVVLGITNQLPLGILISTYEFFLTMSAGIMIGVVAMSLVFGISRFDLVTKRGILLSFATLAAGLLTILIGLGRPDRALYQPLLSGNLSSPIWWVILLAVFFSLVSLGLLYVTYIDRIDSGTARTLGTVAMLLAVGVVVAAGFIFGMAETRSYYGGPTAPVYFLVSGLLSGVAAITFTLGVGDLTGVSPLGGSGRDFVTETLGKYLGLLLGATLIVVLVKAVYGLTATSDSTAMAYEHMLLGSFGPIYWIFGILLGLAVPLLLMAVEGLRSAKGVTGAAALTLIGMFVLRFEFVVGGQIAAQVSGGTNEYPFVSYVPSMPELALVVFAFAVAAFVYTAGSHVLPLETMSESVATDGGAVASRGDGDE